MTQKLPEGANPDLYGGPIKPVGKAPSKEAGKPQAKSSSEPAKEAKK